MTTSMVTDSEVTSWHLASSWNGERTVGAEILKRVNAKFQIWAIDHSWEWKSSKASSLAAIQTQSLISTKKNDHTKLIVSCCVMFAIHSASEPTKWSFFVCERHGKGGFLKIKKKNLTYRLIPQICPALAIVRFCCCMAFDLVDTRPVLHTHSVSRKNSKITTVAWSHTDWMIAQTACASISDDVWGRNRENQWKRRLGISAVTIRFTVRGWNFDRKTNWSVSTFKGKLKFFRFTIVKFKTRAFNRKIEIKPIPILLNISLTAPNNLILLSVFRVGFDAQFH